MGEIYKNKKMKESDNLKNTDSIEIGEFILPTKLNILYRDKEINRIYNIMNKMANRSVLLVGDYGCGKRSIVEGYVNLLADNMELNTDVISFDFSSIFKVANNRREFEEALDSVFKQLYETEKTNILNINNIGHLINFNCFENSGFIFLNKLKKEIETNGVRVIATTTIKEFEGIENHFPGVIDYFTVIKLTELSKEQTCEIIKDEISLFEDRYNIKLPNGIEDTICENADRYIKGKPFPGKGESLLDEVCSTIVGKKTKNPELIKLYENLADLKIKLIDFVEDGDYHECDKINEEIEEINNKIDNINEKESNLEITNDDILEAIGKIVNVPMSKLSKDKTEFLKNLPENIKKDIIGQDETIEKIVKNIRRNQLGLRKKSHSAGNYIFIGSTGVGKTALAKSLAKNLFGSEENILRFDMSEFQTEIDVTKLLGSAPGYVGYKESGLLVKGLANKPECVCLFDEIEKAHPKIYDVLLQLLDEGTITGSDGKKVDGSKALIIFTSNIGVKSAKELSNPMGFSNNFEELKSKKEEEIMRKALNKRFSPEFLNRLDSICYFNNLSKDVLNGILDKELREMNIGIKNITNKEVVLSDEARDWFIDKVEKEHNGARPIIRLLQQEIEEEIANLVIDESPLLKMRKKVLTAKLSNEKIILK